LKLSDLVSILKGLFSSDAVSSVEEAKAEVLSFVKEIEESLSIQRSSTKIMSFGVNNMLSLA
jgi:signal transduction histidine kinase